MSLLLFTVLNSIQLYACAQRDVFVLYWPRLDTEWDVTEHTQNEFGFITRESDTYSSNSKAADSSWSLPILWMRQQL